MILYTSVFQQPIATANKRGVINSRFISTLRTEMLTVLLFRQGLFNPGQKVM